MCSRAVGHPIRILKCSPEGEGVFPSHRAGHKIELQHLGQAIKALQGELKGLQSLPKELSEMKRQVVELGGSQSGGSQVQVSCARLDNNQTAAVDAELQQHHGRLMALEGAASRQDDTLQSMDSQIERLLSKVSALEQRQRDHMSIEALRKQFEKQQAAQQEEVEKLKQKLAHQSADAARCIIS